MNKPYYWTIEEEEAELRSLIEEGYDIPELLELFKNPLDRTKSSIMSKIYNTLDTIPGAKEKMFAKRKAEKAALKNINLQKTSEKCVEIDKPHEGIVKNESDEAKKKRLSKIKVQSVIKKPLDLNFPIVAKYLKNNEGQIVLFTSIRRGVVLVPGDSGLAAGHVNECFAPCTDKSCWDILDEVTLTFYS